MDAMTLCLAAGCIVVVGFLDAAEPDPLVRTLRRNLLNDGEAEQGTVGQKPPVWHTSGYDGAKHVADSSLRTVTGGRDFAAVDTNQQKNAKIAKKIPLRVLRDFLFNTNRYRQFVVAHEGRRANGSAAKVGKEHWKAKRAAQAPQKQRE